MDRIWGHIWALKVPKIIKNHPKMAYFSHNLGIKAISPSEHGVIAYRWIQNDERRSKMYMSTLAGMENLDINAKMRLTNARVVAF